MTEEPRVVRTESAEHYVWGSACDGWRLLERADLSVKLERVPPGAGETRHLHLRARQFFFVLAGEATLEIEGRHLVFGAGEGVHVPPGLRHRFSNRSTADVDFLVVSAPSTAGDRAEVEGAGRDGERETTDGG